MPTVNNAMYSNSRLKFVEFILQSFSTDSTMDKGFLEWWENMAPQLKLVTAWDDQLQLAAVRMELGENQTKKLIPKQPNSLY